MGKKPQQACIAVESPLFFCRRFLGGKGLARTSTAEKTNCSFYTCKRCTPYGCTAFFQNMGTFPQGIAGGYNIVDQKNAFPVKQCFPPRGIYALYIFPPHSFGKGMLRGVFPDLYQRSLVRQVQMQRCLLCKQRRLVISALPSPLCRKRHTCNKIKDHRIFPPYSVCNRSGHLLCILRTVVKFKT